MAPAVPTEVLRTRPLDDCLRVVVRIVLLLGKLKELLDGFGRATETGDDELLLILELRHATRVAVVVQRLLLSMEPVVSTLKPKAMETESRRETRRGLGFLVRKVEVYPRPIRRDASGSEIAAVVALPHGARERLSRQGARVDQLGLAGQPLHHMMIHIITVVNVNRRSEVLLGEAVEGAVKLTEHLVAKPEEAGNGQDDGGVEAQTNACLVPEDHENLEQRIELGAEEREDGLKDALGEILSSVVASTSGVVSSKGGQGAMDEGISKIHGE
jgi:hypothetical protein